MALIVKLFINEKEIASYQAVRRNGKPGELCTYAVSGEEPAVWIDHQYDDGAEALAVKVLLHQLTSKHRRRRHGNHPTNHRRP